MILYPAIDIYEGKAVRLVYVREAGADTLVVADGTIGQMMEPAELPPMQPVPESRPDWALTGARGRPRNGR